jgi:hypothetical protein
MESTERKIETIMTFENVNLLVSYVWDNHGNEVNWNSYVKHPTRWTNANVKINKVTFNQSILDKVFEFEANQLVVNNTKIGGDTSVLEVATNETGVTTVYCKVTVGWG